MPIYYWFPVLGSLGIGFSLLNIPPVADRFMDLFGVGHSGLALFLSALLWSHSLAQVPAGVFIDRVGTPRALIVSGTLCVIGGVGPFLSPHSLALAICMRLIVGVGTAMLFLSLVKAVKILCPPAYITRAQGLQGAAFSCGTMLPYLVLPFFNSGGWAAAYLLGALFPALLLFSLAVVPAARLQEKPSVARTPGVWKSAAAMARSKQLWYIGCCHGFSYGSITALAGWLPGILADAKPGSRSDDWAVGTGVILLAGTVARVLSGELGRRFAKPVLLAFFLPAIGVCYCLLALAPGPLWVFAAGLCLALFCGGTYASVFILTIGVSEPAHVATAVGFMAMVANLVSVALILLLGVVRDFSGSFAPALGAAGFSMLGMVFWSRKMSWPTLKA